jgi:hypothetical protein
VFLAPGVPGGDPGAGVGAAVGTLVVLRTAGIALGAGCIALGSACLAASRPGVRERGWELEALGVATLGLGWLAGVAASAGMAG